MERKTVREWREAKKISREQLAAAIGVAFSTIQRIERGGYQPRLQIALDIARYLEVPVEAIDWGEQLAVAA